MGGPKWHINPAHTDCKTRTCAKDAHGKRGSFGVKIIVAKDPPSLAIIAERITPRGKDTGNSTYIGFALKTCGNCHRENELKRASARAVLTLHRHIEARRNTVKEARKPIREIHRDIAVRYIQRFNGSTFSVQTAADDCDIYLRNAFALTIAKVLATDKYPSDAETPVQDLPF